MFASEKAHVMQLEEQVASDLQKLKISVVVVSGATIQQVGIVTHTIQTEQKSRKYQSHDTDADYPFCPQ